MKKRRETRSAGRRRSDDRGGSGETKSVPRAESEDTASDGGSNPDANDLSAKRGGWFSRRGRLVACLAAGFTLAGGLVFADWWSVEPNAGPATYVGRSTCAECHQQQQTEWLGSHHDRAMDLATDETVLGDFNDARIEHHGIESRLFRRDGRFMIHTEGPDGEMTDFEIKYVFGVDPLQQYMVEFDRPDDMPADQVARVQVLRIAWDTHRRRWFYLPPPDVPERLAPDDDLHWTGVAQRWNNMCADCHSTNLQRNFDDETATYHTTWSEIDVSCEACHGPGSTHVRLARATSLFWDRKLGYGLPKLKSADSHVQIETCAQCHSRRRILHPDFRPGEPYDDYFEHELLGRGTYYADGQIQDEVYVYGSFLQSKMYHKGIRCTDCHDPHSIRLKYEGNAVCTSCHQHPAGKYDSPSHHRHKPDSRGASCVECHMPETTYMEVDPRRDHSLRVPRPDLSAEVGTPNACTKCHLDRAEKSLSAERRAELPLYQDWLRVAEDGDEQVRAALREVDEWAAGKTKEWYGDAPRREQPPDFAATIAQARRGERESLPSLVRLARDPRLSAIVRATLVMEAGQFDDGSAREIAAKRLDDASPAVRAAAVAGMAGEPDNARLLKSLAPLLSDDSRLVRTEAARVLARVPIEMTNGEQRKAFAVAIDEFKAGVKVANDRAGAHMTLGILYEDLREVDQAIESYETAIRVEPRATGPRSNLAALHDRLADEAEQQVQAWAQQGDMTSAAQYARDAQQHRERASELAREELDNLARDARLAPENAYVRFRYGLSLYRHDRRDEAEQELVAAADLAPNDPQVIYAVMRLYYDNGAWKQALPWAEKLVEITPGEVAYQQLLNDIRQQLTDNK